MIRGIQHLTPQFLTSTGETCHLVVHQGGDPADVLGTLPDRFHSALQVVLHARHLTPQVLELSRESEAEGGNHKADDREGEGNDGERNRHGRPDPGRCVLRLKQHA